MRVWFLMAPFRDPMAGDHELGRKRPPKPKDLKCSSKAQDKRDTRKHVLQNPYVSVVSRSNQHVTFLEIGVWVEGHQMWNGPCMSFAGHILI